MFEMQVKGTFDAAHQLRNYIGKCSRLHGHTWTVELKVRGETLDDLGMLVDFGELNRLLKATLESLDHQNLNEIPPFIKVNPTAENIAQYIYDKLKNHDMFQTAPVHLAAVCVWESPRACVTYSEDD